MTPNQQVATLNTAVCEVAFDNLTRQAYATDASVYQIEPLAVAFPSNAHEAGSIIQVAAQAGVPVTPRGAGTGLSGGAIGNGVVVDLARYNRQIWDFNKERRTIRVGAGVVLDQLNAYLRPLKFCFGPDVATSSRATLGGMIANDSSGAHSPVYGTTADHISELDIVTSKGVLVKVGPGQEALSPQRQLLESLVMLNELEINERFPSGLLKRWPGYALTRAMREPDNLAHIIAGSEGTLAAIISAELKIVPLPERRGVGLLYFASVAEAMQAAVTLSDLKPAAVEHIDRLLLDQTRGQREFQAARDLLGLDLQSCESVLIVEFFEDIDERLALLEKRKLGLRRQILETSEEAELVWSLRKAGLSLLTSCKGTAKPVSGIEDAAVRPRDLPAYVAELQKLMQRLELRASYYGHAAAGLLHVRPVLDLHRAEDLKKYRQIADEVAALVKQFKGTLSGEHGVGIARTEFVKDQVGDAIYLLMRQIKQSFDEHNLFNPGKIISDGRYKIDSNLRMGAGYSLKLPFEPRLAFAARDGSFTANLEQCNGCGECLKLTPSMCPTFMATGLEIMSTRGRANAIRAALDLRGVSGDPLVSEELDIALNNCLSCKACTVECPSNVNLSLLKAELQNARIRQNGLNLRERLFNSLDRLGRIGCTMPRAANALLGLTPLGYFGSRFLGLTTKRPWPQFARTRFDHWFAKRQTHAGRFRGRVILWDDTYVRYYEPHVGMAAVQVLEAAGYEVVLPEQRKCCGRPAFSQGDLDEAARLGRHNLALLNADQDDTPIIFLEPACYSMFVDEYRELKLPDAARVAARCFLFEQFVENLLDREPNALSFNDHAERIMIHVHCHAKALTDTDYMYQLVTRIPQRTVTLLEAGCCGMAGTFGMMEATYDLSVKAAAPIIQVIRSQPFGTIFVMSGSSCRQQISHLTHVRLRHMAEMMAEALM
jgi:FAD/FMN-containing dehydrogenase/Fe-S oxidoreductase